MKLSMLSKQNLGPTPMPVLEQFITFVCMEQPEGVVHKGGESHCTLPATESISTSLVAAIIAIIVIPWPPPVCITRRRWGLKHTCSPRTLPMCAVNQMQLHQLHRQSLHHAKTEPTSQRRCKTKPVTIFKIVALSSMQQQNGAIG